MEGLKIVLRREKLGFATFCKLASLKISIKSIITFVKPCVSRHGHAHIMVVVVIVVVTYGYDFTHRD